MNQQRKRNVKKSYVAIAALAALAATGGVVSATITMQSTVAGNSIVVRDNIASLKVQGDPFDVDLLTDYKTPDGTIVQERSFTFTNSGSGAAAVSLANILDASGAQINIPVGSGRLELALYDASTGTKVGAVQLGNSAGIVRSAMPAITVAAGQTRNFTAKIEAKSAVAGGEFQAGVVSSTTFDLQWDYVTAP